MLKDIFKNKTAKGVFRIFVIAIVLITVVIVSNSWRDRQHAKEHAGQHQIK